MIIEELVLHNFGVYLGRHVIDLRPRSEAQPIVLFGGLNGAGKTTILDALQLALFGKFARCSNRGSQAYADYLSRCVHRLADAQDGAAVELQFRHRQHGRETSIRIHRSWHHAGKTVRQHVEAFKDGETDVALTDSWHEFMEDILPARIAHLFFFDGEQIAQFADPATSGELLSTAMHSLLGLDVVDLLSTDLIALERRNRVKSIDTEERQEVEHLSQRVEAIDEERRRILQEKGAARNRLERGEKLLADVDSRFQREGGALFERRVELEGDRERADIALAAAEDELRTLCHGALPLLLVRDQLGSLRRQLDTERRSADTEAVVELLDERDTRVVALLAEQGISDALSAQVASMLAQDREGFANNSRTERYLVDLSDLARALPTVEGDALSDLAQQAEVAIAGIESAAAAVESAERLLAGVPEKDAIAGLLRERNELKDELGDITSEIQAFEARLDRLASEREHFNARLMASLDRHARARFKQQDAKRLVNHSGRVRTTLGSFREAVLRRHIARLEASILESFQHLLRKATLVQGLTIDAQTFQVRLSGVDGIEVAPDRLSAGERQLLAVSILWGLGRASGRGLPVVIDTPMGRLDSTHRSHLVDRYFPRASQQVILLSTDEEVDADSYAALSAHVGRAYELRYDDATQATQVAPGYFGGAA